MCMLSFFPEGVQPVADHLCNGAERNRDGYGFAIVIPGDKPRILVRKSMDSVKIIDDFIRLRAMYPAGPALFHSRLTTHGVTGKYNCHPFMVGKDSRTVLAHNGILRDSVQPGKDDRRSDTRIFAEDFAARMELWTPQGREFVEEWMGSYNKLVIMSVDPRFAQHAYILNQTAGTWAEGAWHSNMGFQEAYVQHGFWTADAVKTWKTCGACHALASVSPRTYLCREPGCGACGFCHAAPCACYVDDVYARQGSVQGKEIVTVNWRNEKGVAGVGDVRGPVVGGSPARGATVTAGGSGSGWPEYQAAVERTQAGVERAEARERAMAYRETLAQWNSASGPDEGDPELGDTLAEVLELVDRMNQGAPVDEDEGDAPGEAFADSKVWDAAERWEREQAAIDAWADQLSNAAPGGGYMFNH